jgi:cytochrome c553
MKHGFVVMIWVGVLLSPLPVAATEEGLIIAKTYYAACHGENGNSAETTNPKLAGQLRDFIELQLKNYRSGERHNTLMEAITKTLTDREIASVSAYYAALPPMKYTGRVDEKLAKRGGVIFNKGKQCSPAFCYCHGMNGEGVAPVFARLAGQHSAFVVASLQPYRNESHFYNPYGYVMKAVMQNLTDSDIKAEAEYVASLSR